MYCRSALRYGEGRGHDEPDDFPAQIGPEPWNVAYVEPSRRPADGRYGENPNRLYQHHQFQVIMKPSPDNIQELYLESLKRLGIDPLHHDIRFVEDNWESPTLGAWGLGWEVWLDGMEITQFTYFQQVGGIDCQSGSRGNYLWHGTTGFLYSGQRKCVRSGMGGRRHLRRCFSCSRNMSIPNIRLKYRMRRCCFTCLTCMRKKRRRAMEQNLVFPAYDYVLKCSHTFNLLDARGAISVTERTGYITRVRNLARACAATYLRGAGTAWIPVAEERSGEQWLRICCWRSVWKRCLHDSCAARWTIEGENGANG